MVKKVCKRRGGSITSALRHVGKAALKAVGKAIKKDRKAVKKGKNYSTGERVKKFIGRVVGKTAKTGMKELDKAANKALDKTSKKYKSKVETTPAAGIKIIRRKKGGRFAGGNNRRGNLTASRIWELM